MTTLLSTASVTIDATTRPVVLLGHPVSHSLSPHIQNLAFRETGQPYVYLAADVKPGNLERAVDGLRALGYRGANVTIPHKRSAMAFIDEISPGAAATGAINTIVCERDGNSVRLMGDNTDIAGFSVSLQHYKEDLVGQTALVLGSGGAARAVAYSLLTDLRLTKIWIATRSVEKARQMTNELKFAGGRIEVLALDAVSEVVHDSTLIVNATPVGMYPFGDESPLSNPSVIGEGHIAYDLVYRPRVTRFLREASEAGARTVDGLEMLIWQAAAAFKQWTGQEMPVERIRESLNGTPESRNDV